MNEYIRKAKGEPFVARDGAHIWELIRPETSASKNLSIAEGLLLPGQMGLPHYHGAGEEIYYVLQGSGRVLLDKDYFQIEQGDAVLIPPNTIHALHNTDDHKVMKILAVMSPSYRDDDMFFVDG